MVRIGSIVVNVPDARSASDFWSAALGYVPRYDVEEGWALIGPPDGSGPNLAFDRGDRTHLDLYLADGEDHEAEVERLVALGARRVDDWPYPDGADFVVLADPIGNLFCVVDKARD